MEAENARLREALVKEQEKSGSPAWVKANRKPKEKKPRKKRAQGYARRRETPTEVQVQVLEACPECGRKLSGGFCPKASARDRASGEAGADGGAWGAGLVVGGCGKRRVPPLDLSGEVVGPHRVGIRLMRGIAQWHTQGRVPIRKIQGMLKGLYGVPLSGGEIVALLQTVAQWGAQEYAHLQASIRGSPMVQADETGWRENGPNGYVWSFSMPSVRYFLYRKSRSRAVIEDVLGEGVEGVLVSDFYRAYNVYLGEHQRCWAHRLRDLHALKEAHPEEGEVVAWAEAVAAVYRQAKAFTRDPAAIRRARRQRYERQLQALAAPHVPTEAPPHTLAARITAFLPELMTLVEYPHVPSDNNAAERALRPVVIGRKVRGGTRSDAGSATQRTLLSLFGTWAAQGQDSLEQCQQLLRGPRFPPVSESP